ncbi:MAG: hypothetical protein AB8B97_08540 [Granulosicoccus sp.]
MSNCLALFYRTCQPARMISARFINSQARGARKNIGMSLDKIKGALVPDSRAVFHSGYAHQLGQPMVCL